MKVIYNSQTEPITLLEDIPYGVPFQFNEQGGQAYIKCNYTATHKPKRYLIINLTSGGYDFRFPDKQVYHSYPNARLFLVYPKEEE